MWPRLAASWLVALCLWQTRAAHAKGLVGKLPGNPASCQEEPCNSDPQHVLAALKIMTIFLGAVLILPLLLYYLSKMFTKIRGVCCLEEDKTRRAGAREEALENQDDDGDDEREEKVQAGRTGSSNLRTISVGVGRKEGPFQLEGQAAYLANEPEQQAAAVAERHRHQSVQYAQQDMQPPLQQQPNQLRQSQRGRQRNSVAKLQSNGSARATATPDSCGSRPTPPPVHNNQTSHEDGEAPSTMPTAMQRQDEMDEEEAAAMAAKFQKSQLQAHRYSMFFGPGSAGVDGSGVGVATPAFLNRNSYHHHNNNQQLLLQQQQQQHQHAPTSQYHSNNLQVTMEQIDQLRMARSTTVSPVVVGGQAAGAYQRVGAHSIRRKKSATHRVAPADGELNSNANEPPPLAHYHAQGQTARMDNGREVNPAADHHFQQSQQHRHERLHANQSSPYAGTSAGPPRQLAGGGKTNKQSGAHHLGLPATRPEHRHSIDGSILNNLLPLSAAHLRDLTQWAAQTPDADQQRENDNGPEPISQAAAAAAAAGMLGQQQKCLEQLEMLQQQQPGGQDGSTFCSRDDDNRRSYIDPQQQQQHHHQHHQHHNYPTTHQGQENGGAADGDHFQQRGQWSQPRPPLPPPATSGQLNPGPAGSRRPSLSAAGPRSPRPSGGFN
ncbi:Hypothetical predicted protein [Olea europaea subsp. europaea]|uniref:Uncharacterized protein n=1 Tax=Olea europaea subsp. europaea TaxID=158383 RepID=A0A8S0UMC3_OLEEU|nr:Hypothetical predicted protein [Olea europaea subsp. europaea]